MINILWLMLVGCRSDLKMNNEAIESENPVDMDGDGFTSDIDCDDEDPDINPDASEICDDVDNDCDELLDDEDDDVEDATLWYADDDADGHGDADISLKSCSQPAGYVESSDDCDDRNDTINPDGEEVCDDVDNNCDGNIDEDTATDALTWFADADEDTYGNPNNTILACDQPNGFVADSTDCDDSSDQINTDMDEVCDEVDNNCDGFIDEDTATDALTWYADADEDTYGDPNNTTLACEQPNGFVADSTDCDDINNMVNTSIVEVCNSIDDNCDGFIDEDTATDALTWFADTDADTFGDPNSTIVACDQPSGFVADNTDCDDTSGAVNTSMDEVCNSVDDNCDGFVDEDAAINAPTWYVDTDSDSYGTIVSTLVQCNPPVGYAAQVGDCNDQNDQVNPGANEVCNLIDDNCDGVTDENTAIDASVWYLDDDADGYGDTTNTITQCSQPAAHILLDGDCDDGNASVNPGASQGCDGVDYNCDGQIDNDIDLDGFSDVSCGGDDCNDSDPNSYPNAGDCYFADCNEILTAGYSTGDGIYTIDLDGPYNGNPAFDVQCDMTTDSGGWTIIDYSLHADWSNQFNGWTSWNSTTAGPNQYASPYSWETWFTLDNGNTEYRVSEDCQIAASATGSQVYKMTGDHYGCVWYNTNCPMVGDQCFECTNPYGTVNLGSCSHFVSSSNHDYNPAEGPGWTCGNHWWNNAPSIGTNGSYCVAYRQ